MQCLGNFSDIATSVGSNANLDRVGREIGLERFIYGALELGLRDLVFGGKTVADTVEADLGAGYLDSGLKKVKEVMDTLDLVSKARRLERMLEFKGFIMFDRTKHFRRFIYRPIPLTNVPSQRPEPQAVSESN